MSDRVDALDETTEELNVVVIDLNTRVGDIKASGVNDVFAFRRAGIAQSVERSLMEREVSRSTPSNAFTGMWKRSARQPCWPPRGQQV